jgi:nicotinate-nucleotide pyrophosphorylase (carboxylating)
MTFEMFCWTGLGLAPSLVRKKLLAFLEEDLGHGDVVLKSAGAVFERGVKARLVAKSDCVVAGLWCAIEIMNTAAGGCGVVGSVPAPGWSEGSTPTDPRWIAVAPHVRDGDQVNAGTVLLEWYGPAAPLLAGERAALNLLARLSGVATYTRRVQTQLEACAAQGLRPPRLLETRKTTPGLKVFEKYATRVGGARNHRMGLDSGGMLKENHLRTAAKGGVSLGELVSRVRAHQPLLAGLEVEVTSLPECEEALQAGADVVMLDNFDTDAVRSAVSLRDRLRPAAHLELSGNLDRLRPADLAALGVDFISMGALIHQATWADLSLQFETVPGGSSGQMPTDHLPAGVV